MTTGFTVHTFASAEQATGAIEHREIYGALVLNNPTDVGVLYATAASPAVAAMIQGSGQHLAEAIHRTATLTDIRSFPDRDHNGVGLAAGALPLALGGWMGATIVMLLVPDLRRRVIAAVGVAVVGGLAVPNFDLDEWRIPHRRTVLVSIADLHENPEIFPHPERFDPYRFRDTKPPTPAWLAFGGGARRCPGADFAITEMDIVLRTVLQNFRIQTDAAADEKSHFRGVAHTPKLGGRVVVNRRT